MSGRHEIVAIAALLCAFAGVVMAQEVAVQPVPTPEAAANPADATRAAAAKPPAAANRMATAASRIELDSTAIRGNQELPKVMYIVPWKNPAMAELAGRPVNSLVEEVLAPVDREVLRRQGRYFQQLYGEGAVTGQSP